MSVMLYHRLLDGQARCNVFDAHVFACILAHRWPEDRDTLGLPAAALGNLLAKYFPDTEPPRPGGPPLPPHLRAEVADLESLLLEHRTQGIAEEGWLATLVARACLDDEPLWRSLGLLGPGNLTALMHRHFDPLARKNPAGGRWKPFLYRALCVRDGLIPCGAPACTTCAAETVCFGAAD